MLRQEELDAVFVVTGYDKLGQPLYPTITRDCLSAGVHVWIGKPPAASCAEIEMMREAARQAGKQVQVGLKKMFFPANEKAKALSEASDFGAISLLRLEYPQYLPTTVDFVQYRQGEANRPSTGFLTISATPPPFCSTCIASPTCAMAMSQFLRNRPRRNHRCLATRIFVGPTL